MQKNENCNNCTFDFLNMLCKLRWINPYFSKCRGQFGKIKAILIWYYMRNQFPESSNMIVTIDLSLRSLDSIIRHLCYLVTITASLVNRCILTEINHWSVTRFMQHWAFCLMPQWVASMHLFFWCCRGCFQMMVKNVHDRQQHFYCNAFFFVSVVRFAVYWCQTISCFMMRLDSYELIVLFCFDCPLR